MRRTKRMASAGVLTGALLLGAWGGAAGAARSTPSYSDEDCTTLLDVQVDDTSGGYWGATALAASEAYGDAAGDIENKQLRKAMKTLAKIWKVLGEKKSVTAAAAATTRFGNRYSNALQTYTEASVLCANQLYSSPPDDTSSTDDSSSTESSE